MIGCSPHPLLPRELYPGVDISVCRTPSHLNTEPKPYTSQGKLFSTQVMNALPERCPPPAHPCIQWGGTHGLARSTEIRYARTQPVFRARHVRNGAVARVEMCFCASVRVGNTLSMVHQRFLNSTPFRFYRRQRLLQETDTNTGVDTGLKCEGKTPSF